MKDEMSVELTFEVAQILFKSQEECSTDFIIKDSAILLTGGDQEFYEWLHRTFNKLFKPDDYKVLFSNCMLDRILFTEQNTTKNLTIETLLGYSCNVPISSIVPPEIVAQYTEWLISTGRCRNLSPELVKNLAEILVKLPASRDPLSTPLKLICAIYLMSDEKKIACIKELVRLENWPVSCLMRNVGLLSSRSGKLAIMQVESDKSVSAETLRNLYFDSAIGPSYSTVGGRLAFNFGLLDDQAYHDIPLLERMLSRIRSIPHSNNFNLTILSYLLEQTPRLTQLTPDKIISLRRVQRDVIGVCAKSFFPLVTIVLLEGDEFVVTRLCNEMLRPKYRKLFIKRCNDIILSLIHSRKDHKRVALLIRNLGKQVDLSILRGIPEDFPIMSVRLAKQLLRRTRDLPDKDWWSDHIITHVIRSESNSGFLEQFLIKNISLLSDNSIKLLLYQCSMTTWDETLGDRITTYACEHLDVHVSTIIDLYVEGKHLNYNITMATPLLGAIHNTEESSPLILGTHVYETSETPGLLVSLDNGAEMITVTTCRDCKKTLSGNVYKDSRDNHGIYACDQCCRKEDSRVSCVVCFSDDEGLEMRVASCGHTYCIDCMKRYAKKQDLTCALCALPIIITRRESVTLTKEAVQEIFWAEWAVSPEDVKRRSLELYREYQAVIPESDDGSTE